MTTSTPCPVERIGREIAALLRKQKASKARGPDAIDQYEFDLKGAELYRKLDALLDVASFETPASDFGRLFAVIASYSLPALSAWGRDEDYDAAECPVRLSREWERALEMEQHAHRFLARVIQSYWELGADQDIRTFSEWVGVDDCFERFDRPEDYADAAVAA